MKTTTGTIESSLNTICSNLGGAPNSHFIDHTLKLSDITVVQIESVLFNSGHFLNQVQELDAVSNFPLSVHPLAPLKETEKSQERLKDRCARSVRTRAMVRKETRIVKCNGSKILRDNGGKLTEEEKQGVLDESVRNARKAKKKQGRCRGKAKYLDRRVRRLPERIEKKMIDDQKKLEELKSELGEAEEASNEAKSNLLEAHMNAAKAVGAEEVLSLKRKVDGGEEDIAEDNTRGCKRRKSSSVTSEELEAPLEESDSISNSLFPLSVHPLALLRETENQEGGLKDSNVRAAQTQGMMRKETRLAKENESKRLRDNWGKLVEEEKQAAWDESVSNVKEAHGHKERCENNVHNLKRIIKKLCERMEKIEREITTDQTTLDGEHAKLNEVKAELSEAEDSLLKAQIDKAKAVGVEEARREEVMSNRIIVKTRSRVHSLALLKETEKKQERVKGRGVRSAQTRVMMRKETRQAQENESKRLRCNWGNLTEEEKQETWDESVSNAKEANKQRGRCQGEVSRLNRKVSRLCEIIETVEKEETADQIKLDEIRAELGEAEEESNEAKGNLVRSQIDIAKSVGVKMAIREMFISDRIISKSLQKTGKVMSLTRKEDAEKDGADDNTDGCAGRELIPGTPSEELEASSKKSDGISTFFLPEEEEWDSFSLEEWDDFAPEKQKAFFLTPLSWEP